MQSEFLARSVQKDVVKRKPRPAAPALGPDEDAYAAYVPKANPAKWAEASDDWKCPCCLRCKRAVKRHGMPLALEDEITINPGREFGSFISLPSRGHFDVEDYRALSAGRLLTVIGRAFGIPFLTSDDPEDDDADQIGEFLEAGMKSIEVQRHRNSANPNRKR